MHISNDSWNTIDTITMLCRTKKGRVQERDWGEFLFITLASSMLFRPPSQHAEKHYYLSFHCIQNYFSRQTTTGVLLSSIPQSGSNLQWTTGLNNRGLLCLINCASSSTQTIAGNLMTSSGTCDEHNRLDATKLDAPMVWLQPCLSIQQLHKFKRTLASKVL